MLFNTPEFYLFFAIIVILFFSIKMKSRWPILLLGSYIFYFLLQPNYLSIIILSTLVSYYFAISIHYLKSCKDNLMKKIVLALGCFFILFPLFMFKYYDFFAKSIESLFSVLGMHSGFIRLGLILPIGISFYTFRILSYLFDVYKNKIEPEKDIWVYASFVSFFPVLVAGPIERADTLLPQFRNSGKLLFNYDRTVKSILLILWGLFKKVVIADRLAVLVNTIFNSPQDYTGIPLIIASFFFTFQIYCDFSGYSDIAIGLSRILGFNLKDNFLRPYFSASINDFWKRWHISLTSWFRDYIYIPLGGNRVSKPRWVFNMMAVFLVSGLWHGANWTFIFWGGIHGIFSIISRPIEQIKNRVTQSFVYKALQILVTFMIVNVAWVFFRADSFTNAFYIITHFFSGLSLRFTGLNVGLTWTEIIIGLVFLSFMIVVESMQEYFKKTDSIFEKHGKLRWAACGALILIILLFGFFGGRDFIYAKF